MMMMNYLIESDGDDHVGPATGGVHVGRGGGSVHRTLLHQFLYLLVIPHWYILTNKTKKVYIAVSDITYLFFRIFPHYKF